MTDIGWYRAAKAAASHTRTFALRDPLTVIVGAHTNYEPRHWQYFGPPLRRGTVAPVASHPTAHIMTDISRTDGKEQDAVTHTPHDGTPHPSRRTDDYTEETDHASR